MHISLKPQRPEVLASEAQLWTEGSLSQNHFLSDHLVLKICVQLSSEHILGHSIIFIHPHKEVEYVVVCLINEEETVQCSMN